MFYRNDWEANFPPMGEDMKSLDLELPASLATSNTAIRSFIVYSIFVAGQYY